MTQMRSHKLLIVVLSGLLIGCNTSKPDESEFNAQVELRSIESEFSEQAKALIEDANRDIESGKIPDYSVVYIVNDDKIREYYALNAYRTRSNVEPGDYFGPFKDLDELIRIRWMYDVFGMIPSFQGVYDGLRINGHLIQELSDEEQEVHTKAFFEYAIQQGIIEPED